MTSGKDIGSFHVVDETTGKRVNIAEILNPDNYNQYFTSSVKGFNSGVVQQDVCCPFHNDTHPSMSINLDEGVWCCHVCQIDGGMVDFEMRLLDTEDKQTAWKSIARKLGVQLSPRARGEMTDQYFYHDAQGEVLYAVRRYEDTTARFYRPTATGKWKAGLNKSVERVPYRLPELVKAGVVIITEGERKADEVMALDLRDATGKPVAVTCTGSADSWRVEYADYFQGKRVLVFPDTDGPGQKYAQAVTASFKHAGIEHQTVDFLPFGNDVRDFLRGRTKEELVEYMQCEWLEKREDEVEV
jgi:putative DNA primase/helicase